MARWIVIVLIGVIASIGWGCQREERKVVGEYQAPEGGLMQIVMGSVARRASDREGVTKMRVRIYQGECEGWNVDHQWPGVKYGLVPHRHLSKLGIELFRRNRCLWFVVDAYAGEGVEQCTDCYGIVQYGGLQWIIAGDTVEGLLERGVGKGEILIEEGSKAVGQWVLEYKWVDSVGGKQRLELVSEKKFTVER